MTQLNRRNLLVLGGSALTTAVAGCSGGDDSGDSDDASTDEPTPTPTEDPSPNLQIPDGDASLTLSLGGGAPDFETLIIDLDRIVFRGDSGTDDATVGISDQGISLGDMPDGGKTYFEQESFPSGSYTAADCYLTVQEAVTSEGEAATFDGESLVTIDLVLFDDPLELASGEGKILNLSMTGNLAYGGTDFTFSTGWSSRSA